MLRGLNKNGGSLLNIGWDIQTNRIQTFPRIIKKKTGYFAFYIGGGKGGYYHKFILNSLIS